MDITELQSIYTRHPNVEVLAGLLEDASVKSIFLKGLCASSLSLFVSSLLR